MVSLDERDVMIHSAGFGVYGALHDAASLIRDERVLLHYLGIYVNGKGDRLAEMNGESSD